MKQKNLEKEESKFEVREAETGETVAVQSQGMSDVRMPQILDSVDEKERVSDPLQGTVNVVTSVASLFREAVVNFSSSLKSQSQVTVLLVMTFAVILLLMQVNHLTCTLIFLIYLEINVFSFVSLDFSLPL